MVEIVPAASAFSLLKCRESAEIAEEDDVTGDFPASQQQPLVIQGLVEIKNEAGSEFGHLPWFASERGCSQRFVTPLRVDRY